MAIVVELYDVMTGNLRPLRVIHDRPLYGKQFNYMEFDCVPTADTQYFYRINPIFFRLMIVKPYGKLTFEQFNLFYPSQYSTPNRPQSLVKRCQRRCRGSFALGQTFLILQQAQLGIQYRQEIADPFFEAQVSQYTAKIKTVISTISQEMWRTESDFIKTKIN
jgi:hypothetical protein